MTEKLSPVFFLSLVFVTVFIRHIFVREISLNRKDKKTMHGKRTHKDKLYPGIDKWLSPISPTHSVLYFLSNYSRQNAHFAEKVKIVLLYRAIVNEFSSLILPSHSLILSLADFVKYI